MFLLMTKKLIARLFFPVPFLLLVLAAGLALVLWPKLGTRCRKAGNALLVTGVLLLLIGSLAGQLLLHTLTGVYPPLKPEELPEENYTIVVAGHGFHAESGVPPERWFDDEMQLRLHEAARIGRVLGERKIPYRIVASITGKHDAPGRKREALNAFLGHYGIPPERIAFLENALNSRQEVQAFTKEPGRKILVSEAYHMPRLMMLSDRYELDALPAPATRVSGNAGGILKIVPSAENLSDCERAVYEYLGMLEYLIF